jgi:hypothetical protein
MNVRIPTALLVLTGLLHHSGIVRAEEKEVAESPAEVPITTTTAGWPLVSVPA